MWRQDLVAVRGKPARIPQRLGTAELSANLAAACGLQRGPATGSQWAPRKLGHHAQPLKAQARPLCSSVLVAWLTPAKGTAPLLARISVARLEARLILASNVQFLSRQTAPRLYPSVVEVPVLISRG